jgi:protoporphyrinogen oxidase
MVAAMTGDRIGHVAVIGGGFTGLAAALELARAGASVTLMEAESSLGGLAGSFDLGETSLERFYHHWFSSDIHIAELIDELGASELVSYRTSRTGLYYAQSFFRLSNPLDVMRFSPLSIVDRIRLGLMVLRVRGLRDWRELEAVTAKEWLIKLAGPQVYRVVWEPLLAGKFGLWADRISAVWFWNKIVLRGGSRNSRGSEELAYFMGGFQKLTSLIRDEIIARGGRVRLNCHVLGLECDRGAVIAVKTTQGTMPVSSVLATPALPIVADLLQNHVPESFTKSLRRIEYLANICLVLELDRSLSQFYWLNVNDPDFPFVGIIEHTNMESTDNYAGKHVVYLSKYLSADHPLYRMNADELAQYALPHVRRMFPCFDPSWIKASHAWSARYAQPIVEKNYSRLIPPRRVPLANMWLCSMAQIYPEDRGTNYAVREGRACARDMVASLTREKTLTSQYPHATR